MKFEDTFDNRSEVAFIWEASDCNPNGNPLAANNQPRVDTDTGEAIVTDGRIKRYIRDELFDRGHQILIQSPKQHNEGTALDLETIFEKVCEQEEIDLDIDGDEEIFRAFLNTVADVRFFGSAFAGVDKEKFDSITGPVQVTPARSYNEVQLNDEYSKITSVLSSSKENETGTFGTDSRLMYAVIGTSAVCNERLAEFSGMTETDIETLDEVLWDSIYNQTLTRSKIGQKPLVYIRVEFENGHHIGNLDKYFQLETDMNESEIRSIDDYSLSVDALVELLSDLDNIEKVVVREDELAPLTYNGSETTLTDVLTQKRIPVNEL